MAKGVVGGIPAQQESHSQKSVNLSMDQVRKIISCGRALEDINKLRSDMVQLGNVHLRIFVCSADGAHTKSDFIALPPAITAAVLHQLRNIIIGRLADEGILVP